MKNKKVLIVQIVIISIISLIATFTYIQILKDEANYNEVTLVDRSAPPFCPVRVERRCCPESYCDNTKLCPLLPRECLGQSKEKFCFQYSWKLTQTNSCADCNMPSSFEKVYKECDLEK